MFDFYIFIIVKFPNLMIDRKTKFRLESSFERNDTLFLSFENQLIVIYLFFNFGYSYQSK